MPGTGFAINLSKGLYPLNADDFSPATHDDWLNKIGGDDLTYLRMDLYFFVIGCSYTCTKFYLLEMIM